MVMAKSTGYCEYPVQRKTSGREKCVYVRHCRRNATGLFDGKPMCIQHIRIERAHQKSQ